jgi:hypothetical protein
MLFTGTICVDPSEITKIRKVEPSSFFKRFLHTISQGKINDLMEEENFTAVSIIQQFNVVLKAMGISNIIRLSHNGKDYYLDKFGQEDDLDQALKNYNRDINPEETGSFRTLSLVLENNEDSFHYFIEIKVNRSHKVGDYPIEIKVDGLLNEFFEHLIDKKRLEHKMEHVFRSQDAYDFFVTSKLNEFGHFLNMVGDEIKKAIPVDDLVIDYSSAIILPRHSTKHPSDIKTRDYQKGPAFHGYYQCDERLWYAYVWPELCSDHDMYINNTLIISENGNIIGSLDKQGIEAGDSPLFDLETSQEDRYDEKVKTASPEQDHPKSDEDWF